MSELKFEKITTEAGLSHNNVWYIMQDTEGFMWILTEGGLNRYDGYNFILFENDPEDPDSFQKLIITAMCEDDDGMMWFGTRQGILVYFDRQNEKFIYKELDFNTKRMDKHRANDWIHNVYDNNQGNLFLCTGRNGLQIFNKNDNSTSNYFAGIVPEDHPLTRCSITAVILTEDNNLWLSTFRYGIYKYDINKNELINYLHLEEDKNSLCDNVVYGLFEDSNKNIWAITHNGLNLYMPENNNFNVFLNDINNPSSISNNYIHTIAETFDKEIWIGTYDGLNKYAGEGAFKHYRYDAGDKYSISSNAINYLYTDRTNVLWIGTDGAGLNRLDCECKKFHSLSRFNLNHDKKNNLNESIGTIFIDSSEDILVGVRSYDGLFKFTKKNSSELEFKKYLSISENLRDNNLIHIVQENDSVYWLCSYFGDLIEYNKEKESFTIYEKPGAYFYYSMCISGKYLLIAINVHTLLKFDLTEKKYVDLNFDAEVFKELPKVGLFCLYKDIHNDIWMGSHMYGLIKYEVNNNKIKIFKPDPSDLNTISDYTIMSINNDSKGNLWIGTDLGGLCKFNYSDETFVRYTRKNGIPNRVTGILEDNGGHIWLRADNGLYRFDTEKESARYFESDQILQRFDIGENTCAKDKDGTLYFGGIEGLTYFDPQDIKDNPYIPEIVLTDFKIFNQSIKPDHKNPFLKKTITSAEEITLSYRESVFSFEFAALIYNNPSRNQYAYMMEGFDKDWVYCGTRRQATYTNLDPGEYVFSVKASNNDNVWNEEGASVRIIITPPYWKTWWFKGFGILSMLTATGLTYKSRISKMQKEKKQQEDYSRMLLSSQEMERKRIANELHDSVAHEILLLKNNAVNAMNATKDPRTKTELTRISEQSAETLNEVRNISYNLHPHQIEALGITKAIKSIVNNALKSTKINFITDLENIDKIFSEEEEVYIYRIIQEAISNIIKHSNSTEAIIRISCTKESVCILISDSGDGFEKAKAGYGSLGLSGISERVKMLGGKFNIESGKGEGTLMKILIPARKIF